jgi:hypothetical protein
MKNKNALYIVLGIGAGVVAYYLFCKKKDEAQTNVKSDEKPKDKPTPNKGTSVGGGFTPVIAPVLTPVATTPIVVNITKPAITKTDFKLPPKPIATISPTTLTRPSVTPVAPIVSQPTNTSATLTSASTTAKVGFDGGQQSFEVGECLHDL